jgi:NRAMP (natural resistance-associated macrophage protein)-like metal ion transporter
VTARTTRPAAADSPGRRLTRVLGPGLISGASDDDPSGIATYSQVGAQFGYGLAWSLIVSYPLMAAIQEISARIGRVTGIGVAGNLRRHFPAWLSRGIVGLLLAANVINLGADLGAMGAALKLVIGGPALLYVILLGILSAGIQIFTSYARFVAIMKWLCLSLLAYVVCAFVVDVHWLDVGRAILHPPIIWSADYLVGLVAVLGTTISPYLFFWQAEQEVENEKKQRSARPLRRAPRQAPAELHRIRIDTYIGMGLSNLIAFFIVITTAATLHAHGITNVETSAQAAEALRAIAGPLTFVLFATGIIGTGFLAMPALGASAAFALGEIMSWRVGLDEKPAQAKRFYATIAAATAVGVILNFLPVDPMKALYGAAVLNGLAAAPVMVLMMLLAVRPSVMGKFTLPRSLQILGWIATAAMAASAAAMIVSWFA